MTTNKKQEYLRTDSALSAWQTFVEGRLTPGFDARTRTWAWRSSMFWVCAWYGLFVFDQVFIKAIVDKYPASGWERTLYQVRIPCTDRHTRPRCPPPQSR